VEGEVAPAIGLFDIELFHRKKYGYEKTDDTVWLFFSIDCGFTGTNQTSQAAISKRNGGHEAPNAGAAKQAYSRAA
jgi:hypothetical protein